jgi:replication factor C subunit 2/4
LGIILPFALWGWPALSRIIEPLASRCSKFRFTPLSSSATLSRLEHIAASESIAVSPQAFKALITTSDGDLRRSITYLQSAARLSLSVSSTGARPITPADIQEIAGTVPDPVVLRFLAALGVDPSPGSDDAMDVDGDESAFIKPPRATGFNGVRDVVKEIIRAGYSTAQLIIQVWVTYPAPSMPSPLQLHSDPIFPFILFNYLSITNPTLHFYRSTMPWYTIQF